ncbi:hypothetical protein E2C01_022450 [Portunus trituberculatus]|uniref:Uncharacterized protein n=1 Tax=Portunus trituberculatus TaxID=210409 RepID=A0A5B7E610_PORTR|nr:hypothetical protein [Portunus trituberculatus]
MKEAFKYLVIRYNKNKASHGSASGESIPPTTSTRLAPPLIAEAVRRALNLLQSRPKGQPEETIQAPKRC